MIKGIGVDIIEISRVESALKKYGKKFSDKIAHSIEKKLEPTLSSKKAQYWASRFAAKEAFAKAMGKGIGKVVSFESLGVKKDKLGKPLFVFSPKLSATLKRKKIKSVHLSISHTDTHALAFVVLE